MSNMDALIEAYRKATYSVETGPDKIIRFKIEETSAPLDELLNECNATCWAFITAFNPGSRQLSKQENAARHTQLVAKLQDQQYRFFEGEGADETGDWPRERSLLVLNIQPEAALAIARDFEQVAIVYGKTGSFTELLLL